MCHFKSAIYLSKNRDRCFLIALIFLFFISSLFSLEAASAEEQPLIKLIEIRGNKKIEGETISGKIKSKIGEPFSEEILQQDIKKLYSIGYFDDIRTEIEPFEGGLKLIFIFKEKPTIVSIDFQGNEEVKTDDLKEKITITPGAIASPSLITDNVNKVVSFYQSEGYWDAKVIPVTREISGEAVALTFQITEGDKAVIKTITITGNKALSSKMIKKAMKTKERWFLSFLTNSGIYSKEDMEIDVERIKELYHSKGYISVSVSEPEVTFNSEKTKIYIKISVSEGSQYKVGEFGIKGNTVFSTPDILKSVETASGKIFNKTALREDIDRILALYSEKGYARADVEPLINVDNEGKVANIMLSIIEEGIYRVGKIEISGNTKTRDKVIRREVRLDEGDIFNGKLLNRSYQRINNLDYFETANISSTPRADEKLVDLNINVKEKLTGMMSIGGGYSSIDKFMFMGEVTQRNLFGKGLYLSFKANLSSIRTNYNISLNNPWFMDKPISATFNLYNESFQYPNYDKKANGVSIGFGKELSEYVRGNINYTLEEVEITDIAADASSLIKSQEGKKVTSSISPSIWIDTRDNYLDPTTGSRNALHTTFAGIGGDNYFAKGVIDSSWYFPVIRSITFNIRGRFGYASGFSGKELPLYERFYVGGINTVRGLGFGEAGPRNEENEKIGGNRELIFNTEFIFPIAKEIRLKGVVFFDAGRAFDDSENISFAALRPTVGAGFRWMSPFGPIRLEWGYNLDRQFDEGSNKIEFSMGSLF
ncbi:MAG: outer membrane protein assembly factor BamA [Nitrospirae bacterium]|nr:outer membrane protein assembly factor BamA [Nitrospirota bacterium]